MAIGIGLAWQDASSHDEAARVAVRIGLAGQDASTQLVSVLAMTRKSLVQPLQQ